jgi:hypothetical protein
VALYRAKTEGCRRYAIFDAAMHVQALHTDTLNACGGTLRPPTVARPSEPGIPWIYLWGVSILGL